MTQNSCHDEAFEQHGEGEEHRHKAKGREGSLEALLSESKERRATGNAKGWKSLLEALLNVRTLTLKKDR